MLHMINNALKCCYKAPFLHYTIMDFLAGVHDVICTRKINIDQGLCIHRNLFDRQFEVPTSGSSVS